MRAAVYARVSTPRQAQAQTIEQQLDRLRSAVAGHGWELEDQHVYRDDGYSGASLGRPGLDRLRDHAALADLDVVVVTAPDRLARNYVHQVLLIEELAGHGCRVEFLDRPMSDDPHDQLLLQIRGAVAEYERTLITERMRRGRHARLRAGTLLPWTRPPFGYRLDPGRPRDAAGVRTEPGEAALVAQLFDWYLQPQATLYRLTARLAELGAPTPTGKPRWTVASVRGILRNPAYAGRALTNRTRVAPARRKSALLPAGPGQSHAPRPEEEWIEVPVPQIVGEQTFAQVQAKLDANQQAAARNTRHEYLLRALVSCGACRLACTGRQTGAGYRYYLCRGRTDALRAAQGRRCTARYIPAGQLDELVWADLCALLTDPAQVAHALARARDGAWLPQELRARQATIRQALGRLERQQQRLLDAYLAEVLALPELQRKRQELDRRHATLLAQQRQLDAAAGQQLKLQAVAAGIERFCQAIRAGLATATFEQRRQLAELLIDRVIVTDDQVEIRYVLPTSPDGPHRPFCQLRKDHLDLEQLVVGADHELGRDRRAVWAGPQVRDVALQPGQGAGFLLELAVHGAGAAGQADEPVAFHRGLAGHGLLGLADLLVDAAQGAAGPVVPVLVIDHLVAAAAVRPGRPRLGEDLPIGDLLTGMLAPPLLHDIRLVRDLRAEDERQARRLDRLLVGLAHHARVRDDRHVRQMVRGHEGSDDRQHGLRLRLVAFKGGHHEREPGLVGEQADGDLRLQAALLGEPALAEPVTFIGLEIQGLCRPCRYADVRRAAAGHAVLLVQEVGIFIGGRASRGCLAGAGKCRVRCRLAGSGQWQPA
jgi:site-specific DNA recombinase